MPTSVHGVSDEHLLLRKNDDVGTSLSRLDAAQLAGAALLAVSAGVHLRLFLGGYRDIHLRDVFGVDLAGTFVAAVITGSVVASLLVASVVYQRAARMCAVAGVAYALGALVAYTLTRTSGFLGFEEDRWVPEALVSKPVELAACILLIVVIRHRTVSGRPLP
jgi:hypothetical protein